LLLAHCLVIVVVVVELDRAARLAGRVSFGLPGGRLRLLEEDELTLVGGVLPRPLAFSRPVSFLVRCFVLATVRRFTSGVAAAAAVDADGSAYAGSLVARITLEWPIMADLNKEMRRRDEMMLLKWSKRSKSLLTFGAPLETARANALMIGSQPAAEWAEVKQEDLGVVCV
jgi:hypothetical protein